MTRELWRGAGGLRAELSDLYREPHQHPELSLQEFRTARRVAGALQPFGIEVTTGVGGAGIVAVMHNGAGPTVMLRADFDAAVPLALSWHEMGDQGTTGSMSERVGRRDPHLAVKREVLVRYLDAWTPVVLRSHRGATYVESGDSDFVVDAFRVFGEFVDRLDGQHLDMVIVGASADSAVSRVLREFGEPPAGLSVGSVAEPANLTVAGPMLAHLDLVEDSGLAEPDAWRLAASLARGQGAGDAAHESIYRPADTIGALPRRVPSPVCRRRVG
jgi:hypothetical protein